MEEVFDVAAVVRQIYDLLIGDVTLSMSKRNELAKNREDDLLFLTSCILAGMMRNSVKKNKKGRQLDFDDYLLDYHYPRSNKAFSGRDKELDAIHKILTGETCVFLYGIGGIGKSKLAIHYGKRFEKEYQNILYLNYTGSLYQTTLLK